MRAFLILEDGSVYEGKSFGAEKEAICEVVFNTSMIGYPELLTDPSYAGQGIVMTYPVIGSYGLCYEDMESERPWCSAFIVRELNRITSNFRADVDLNTFLSKNGVVGIEGIDTRALTRHLRENGTMKGMITHGDSYDSDACIAKIRAFEMSDLVKTVSHKEKYTVGEGGKYKIALVDFGSMKSVIKTLTAKGCEVTVYPQNTAAEVILDTNPDGIVLSNGPGNPKSCTEIIENIKKLTAAKIPVFGIGLGHQLAALASGFDTYKLTYGHRGGNHPVKCVETGKVRITSQGHGYVVDEKSVKSEIAEISYRNVNDKSVEGLKYTSGKMITVQFHPEAMPRPLSTKSLFDEFLDMIGEKK